MDKSQKVMRTKSHNVVEVDVAKCAAICCEVNSATPQVVAKKQTTITTKLLSSKLSNTSMKLKQRERERKTPQQELHLPQ